MKELFPKSILRRVAWKLHLMTGMIAIMVLTTAAGVQATPPNPCPGEDRNCAPTTTGTLQLRGYETRHFDLICPKDRPYYQGKWTKEIDSNWVGVTPWSWTGLVQNDRDHFSVTNWIWDGHSYNISIACSSSPPTGICVTNPGCPDDPGTRHESGSGYSWWSNWNEICADGTYCVCSTVALRVCCNCERKKSPDR